MTKQKLRGLKLFRIEARDIIFLGIVAVATKQRGDRKSTLDRAKSLAVFIYLGNDLWLIRSTKYEIGITSKAVSLRH